jgi:X-Pro dipeptidyl-peptidase
VITLRLLLASVVALAAFAPPVAAKEPTPPPWLKVEDGVTQPQFDAANAIEEVVFVE